MMSLTSSTRWSYGVRIVVGEDISFSFAIEHDVRVSDQNHEAAPAENPRYRGAATHLLGLLRLRNPTWTGEMVFDSDDESSKKGSGLLSRIPWLSWISPQASPTFHDLERIPVTPQNCRQWDLVSRSSSPDHPTGDDALPLMLIPACEEFECDGDSALYPTHSYYM